MFASIRHLSANLLSEGFDLRRQSWFSDSYYAQEIQRQSDAFAGTERHLVKIKYGDGKVLHLTQLLTQMIHECGFADASDTRHGECRHSRIGRKIG